MSWWKDLPRYVRILIVSVTTLFLLSFLFWMLFLNHIGINEIGVAYNSSDGSITVQDKPGWYVTNPWTFVANFSTLPMKVTIPSSAAVINTKIVRFKREGVEEYIRLQGFSWFSSNLENNLMGYAFSGKEYPSLEVIQEAEPSHYVPTTEEWKRVSGKEATSGQ